MPTNAKELIKIAQTLQGRRSNFETKWQEIADIFRPLRADIQVTRTPGDKTQFEKIYESFPIVAVETFASILSGVLTNKAARWGVLDTVDKDLGENKEIASWLSDVSDIMLDKAYEPKTNFEQSLNEAYKEFGTIGTAGIKIEEDDESLFSCQTLSIKNFLIAENSKGVVDYVVVKTKMDARQMIEKWGNGKGNLNPKIEKINRSDPFHEFDLQLHIFPRKGRDVTKIDTLNKPIAGVWLDVSNQTIIDDKLGFDSMPIAVGRSEKATGEVYGTSRAMMALADANQLNVMSRQINHLTELAGKPPLNVNAAYDKALNLTPGALNYPKQSSSFNNRAALEQIITVGNIPLNRDLITRKEERIREAFFLDKIKIIDDPRATATQVLELRAEMFRIMSPISTGLQPFLEGILSRIFDILFRRSFNTVADDNGIVNYELLPGAIFPELPDALKEAPDLKVKFVNPVNQSHKVTELNAIDSFVQKTLEIAQVVPEALDVPDFDEIIRKWGDISDVDPELLNDKRETQAIRAERAAQLQQAQQFAEQQAMVDSASKAKQAGLQI